MTKCATVLAAAVLAASFVGCAPRAQQIVTKNIDESTVTGPKAKVQFILRQDGQEVARPTLIAPIGQRTALKVEQISQQRAVVRLGQTVTHTFRDETNFVATVDQPENGFAHIQVHIDSTTHNYWNFNADPYVKLGKPVHFTHEGLEVELLVTSE